MDLTFKPVKLKTKLSHLVLENIKDALVNGQLRPGDCLPSINELATSMGVGVSSVREAVKMLEILDILDVRQGEGTFVTTNISENAFNALSLQFILMDCSIKDQVEFRRIFETLYTNTAMKNMTQNDYDELDEIVKRQEKKVTTEKLGAEDEREFHSRVIKATHNPYLIRLSDSLLELFLSKLPVSAELVNTISIAKDHRRLLNAFKNNDADAVQAVLEKTFVGWEQRLEGKPFVEPE